MEKAFSREEQRASLIAIDVAHRVPTHLPRSPGINCRVRASNANLFTRHADDR